MADDSEFASLAEQLAKQLAERIVTGSRKPEGVTQIRFDDRRRVR